MIFLVLLVSLPLAFAPSCKKTEEPPAVDLSPPVSRLPTAQLNIAGRVFTVELAFKNETRARGMMFRRTMPPDTGMLFIFETPQAHSFYMKNCYLDLDIAFLDASGRILNTFTMKAPAPGSTDYGNYESAGPMKYAIELPAGTVARLNLQPGQIIPISDRIHRVIPDP